MLSPLSKARVFAYSGWWPVSGWSLLFAPSAGALRLRHNPLSERCQEVTQFFANLSGIVQCLCDFSLDDVPKTAAKPVNRDSHCPLAHLQLLGNLDLREFLGIAGQPWLQCFELIQITAFLVLTGQRI